MRKSGTRYAVVSSCEQVRLQPYHFAPGFVYWAQTQHPLACLVLGFLYRSCSILGRRSATVKYRRAAFVRASRKAARSPILNSVFTECTTTVTWMSCLSEAVLFVCSLSTCQRSRLIKRFESEKYRESQHIPDERVSRSTNDVSTRIDENRD